MEESLNLCQGPHIPRRTWFCALVLRPHLRNRHPYTSTRIPMRPSGFQAEGRKRRCLASMGGRSRWRTTLSALVFPGKPCKRAWAQCTCGVPCSCSNCPSFHPQTDTAAGGWGFRTFRWLSDRSGCLQSWRRTHLPWPGRHLPCAQSTGLGRGAAVNTGRGQTREVQTLQPTSACVCAHTSVLHV